MSKYQTFKKETKMSAGLVFLLCSIIIALCAGSPVPDGELKGGFVTIGGKSYWISNYESSPEGGMFSCNMMDRTLLDIENSSKNQLIRQYMRDNGLGSTPFWTSGQKINDIWQWTYPSWGFTYFDWAPQQPDQAGDSPCLYFTGDEGWFDGPCETLYLYLCQ